MVGDNSRVATSDEEPAHRVIVLPFLRAIGRKLIMPDWVAMTVGHRIFAWRELDQVELAHELVHVRQWRENGFFGFIFRYWSASKRAKSDGGDRYRDNKFEIEARAAEAEVRQSLVS